MLSYGLNLLHIFCGPCILQNLENFKVIQINMNSVCEIKHELVVAHLRKLFLFYFSSFYKNVFYVQEVRRTTIFTGFLLNFWCLLRRHFLLLNRKYTLLLTCGTTYVLCCVNYFNKSELKRAKPLAISLQ